MTHTNGRIQHTYIIMAGNQAWGQVICPENRIKSVLRDYRKALGQNVRAISC